ncbi:MAG: AAA family ATPase [Bacteroidales bacterium]|nr:AAA family ATPase [Candidatus Sodaliphilus aphodohippi]
MESLFKKHKILISQVSMDIVRDTIDTIAWNRPLVAIRGSRGVGKTTLMRQYIRLHYGTEPGEALYCALDSIYFSNHSLLALCERFHMLGGKHLFLDEVHKYPHWSKEIKEINDLFPDLRITFTGSSLIQILNADADLSRRVLSYSMHGLSFREYMRFYHNIDLPAHSLEDILANADEVCAQVNAVCRPQQMFEQYLRVGFYPFFDGNEIEYYSRLENVISFIIDQEMVEFCNIDPAYTRKLKAMLLYLAANTPYEVNINKLAAYLELNKATVLNYLSSMERAELLQLLYSDNKSVTKMQKPDKIYIHNPNMLNALADRPNIGTVRECFVVNQLATNHVVEYGKTQGDFKVDGKWTFEVGGSNKSFDQIAGLPDSYVLADAIEHPVGKKLPLWLVGLTY